jgi:hypothetical protein
MLNCCGDSYCLLSRCFDIHAYLGISGQRLRSVWADQIGLGAAVVVQPDIWPIAYMRQS